MTIEELIAALERADAPSRELELRIARDVLDSEPLGHAAGLPDKLLIAQAEIGPWPRYTSSIDAALSLVPEGWDYIAGYANGQCFADCGPANTFNSVGQVQHDSFAIAICVAALKARAAT